MKGSVANHLNLQEYDIQASEIRRLVIKLEVGIN